VRFPFRMGLLSAALMVFALLVLVGTGLILSRDVEKGWEEYNKDNYNGALAHFLPLAIIGDPNAQESLGYFYFYKDEKIFPDSMAKAIMWFRKAAEQGYGYSALETGYWFFNGEGVKKDYVKASKWLRIAADKRVEDAAFLLAEIYKDGLGEVPRDFLKAKFWYEEAVRYRDADPAQLELGKLYETVFENYSEAYRWYWLYGSPKAHKRLKVLSEKLTPEQIEWIIDDAERWQYEGDYWVPIEYQALWNEWRLNEGQLELVEAGSPMHKLIEQKNRRYICGTIFLERETKIKAAINTGKPVEYVARLVREQKNW
jgi:TPR repeat protein